MPPQMIEYFGGGFGLEAFYSFIIIACSLMIYFGTKELYELSSHKGIKYFRLSFLFFAIAYFARSLIKFVINYFQVTGILHVTPRLFGSLTLAIFMYFSLIAIFYLLYSVIWKKWKEGKIILFHIAAVLIALSTIIFTSPPFYLLINLFILILAISAMLISREYSKKKKNYNLYAIYVLLAVFWTLNILEILTPDFLRNVQLLIYIASTTVFLIILYRVLKKTGAS